MTQASDIERVAAIWLARRDASGERGEAPEFTAWLAADPRHRAAYLRLAAAWERSAKLKRLRLEQEPIDADLLKGRRRAPLWPEPLGLAAAIVAVVVAACSLWWLAVKEDTTTYRTDVGGLSRVVLSDGSTVTLNTDTELTVHFTASWRDVTLRHGEAQFTVAHNRARPFEVHALGQVVRAVGTAFDVRLARGQSVEVTVTDGRVALFDAAPAGGVESTELASTSIAAGEAALATHKNVTVHAVSAADIARRLAWETGELSFQGETLAEAAAEFNRYNRRKLVLDDPSIANLQIGGNFQALDVDSFVAALNRSFGITASTAQDGTVFLARSGESSHD